MAERPDRGGDRRDHGRDGTPARDSRAAGSGRPPRDGRPARDGKAAGSGRPSRDGAPSHDGKPARDGKPAWESRTPRDGKPSRDGKPAWESRTPRDGKPARSGGPARAFRADDPRSSRPNRPEGDNDRPRHDDPAIPDEITGKELDRIARNELRTLAKENAERVAQHLVMASMLIDEDPALAHRHAQAAARRAGRIAVTRETLAITAYAIGDFALALRELRTYRRISGSNEQLPLMVDSERGLGRPEKALELGRSVDRSTLTVGTRVELAIAMSGARLDLGQPEQALIELEIPQLKPETAYRYSPALFDAYAIVLDELGRTAEADEWARRADLAADAIAEADGDGPDDGDETIEIIELDDHDDPEGVDDEPDVAPTEVGDDAR